MRIRIAALPLLLHLTALLVVALALPGQAFGTSLAAGPQLSAPAPAPMLDSLTPAPVQDAPGNNGWVEHLAPTRPLPAGPLPPGTGYLRPPVDMSHIKGDRMPAGVSAEQLPSRFDWRERGIITRVQDQNPCGACYAFAFLGSFESKLQLDGAGSYDFSENHAKECNWEEANNYQQSGRPSGSCDGGGPDMMTNLFSEQGTVLESCDPYVASDVACRSGCPYQKTLLGWRYASGDDMPLTEVLKAYLHTYGPLATSMYSGQFTFESWKQEFSAYDGSYTLYYPGSHDPSHCVLIVGWDDNLEHAGGRGAWIVKNSWGTNWGGTCGYGGERGYFTIAYGSASIGTNAGFVSEWQEYDASGGMLHFDDAGYNGRTGWLGQTTDWGLCKFTASQSGTVTRVEFWTTDATTDVDVYIYSGFDGSRLSGLLRSEPNLSYPEAGYYSVPVDPLPVAAGSEVVAVVKLTNASLDEPLALDRRGPSERGRTYHSATGADGSWRDVGDRFNADVAIRLRTSGAPATATPSPTPTRTRTPTQTPTLKPFTPVAWIRLPVILKSFFVPVPTSFPTPTSIVSLTPTKTATLAVTPTRTPTLGAVFSGVRSLPGEPYSLSLNTANGRCYVARDESQDVAVLDTSSVSLLNTVPLAEGVKAIRVNPALARAYASYGDPLYVISCASDAVVAQIAKGVYSPYELALNPSNGRVYVADRSVFVGQDDQVEVYDGGNSQHLATVSLGSTSYWERIAVAVNRNTGLAYAAYSGDRTIAVIGLDSQIATRITPSEMATDPWLAVNAMTNRLYLRGSSRTVAIDLNSNSEIGTLDQAGLIAVDELRNRIYVQRTSKIYVYDGASNARLREIALDKYRYVTDIACDAATRRIFLAAPSDDEIVVVAD